MRHGLRNNLIQRRRGLLIAAMATVMVAMAGAPDARARIIKSKPAPSSTFSSLTPLTLGGGIEFQTDKDQSEYNFPLLIEYNFSEQLKLTIEPTIVSIASKSKDTRSASGMGDLETSIEYEFLRERRWRPALTAEFLIRWPTATNRDLGNPGTDFSLGLIASKDLVFVDVDLTALYTFMGDRHQENTLEVALAGEWHLNRKFDLITEIVHTFGVGGGVGGGGGGRSQGGNLGGVGLPGGGGANETEGTIGLAWHVNKHLKLEQGVVLKSDGSWQLVAAWEYSFSGD